MNKVEKILVVVV